MKYLTTKICMLLHSCCDNPFTTNTLVTFDQHNNVIRINHFLLTSVSLRKQVDIQPKECFSFSLALLWAYSGYSRSTICALRSKSRPPTPARVGAAQWTRVYFQDASSEFLLKHFYSCEIRNSSLRRVININFAICNCDIL